jgi:IS605 OrfB family transposase
MDQKQGRKKEANQSTKLSIRDTRARQRCTTRNQDMLKRKAHDLVESAIKNGHDHIIMEDIGNFAKSFTKNEEFDGFKYSRLVKLLNLADLKNIVTSIANKRGVNVSFVQPEYTSKACQCGNISDNNRKTQEEFICSSCGVCMNADHHAAVMIQDRVADDVLKALLLTKDGTRFMPKKISRQKIKSIIHDHYVDKTTDVN